MTGQVIVTNNQPPTVTLASPAEGAVAGAAQSTFQVPPGLEIPLSTCPG